MDERFVRNLVKMVKCARCGRRYSPRQVSVLGHQDELWFLSVACPVCQTRGLVAALVKEQAEAPPVGELAEQATVGSPTPIGVDDVLDMHEFLQTFDGDFAELFRRENEEQR